MQLNNTIKFISITTIIILTLIMSFASVYAQAQISVTSDLNLGGSNVNRNEDLSYLVTITNTGNETLTNLNLELNAKTEFFNNISINYPTGKPQQLIPQASYQAEIKYNIAKNKDSLNENAGSLKATGYSNAVLYEQTKTINLEAKSYLRINDIVVYVDDDNEGDDDIEVRRRQNVRIVVTIENLYDDDDNIEIEDVFFEIDSNNDWDFADGEESNEENIKEEDEVDFEVEFEIDEDDIDDETITMRIIAKGNDEEDDFTHYDFEEIDFEFYLPSDELEISKFEFQENPVNCDKSFVYLNLEIDNIGSNDQEKVIVMVTSGKSELNWTPAKLFNVQIDEDETYTHQYMVPIRKDKGTYFVEAKVYNDDSEETDSETAYLEITCDSSNNVVINNTDDEEEEEEEEVEVEIVTKGDLEYQEPQAGNEFFFENLWQWFKNLFN